MHACCKSGYHCSFLANWPKLMPRGGLVSHPARAFNTKMSYLLNSPSRRRLHPLNMHWDFLPSHPLHHRIHHALHIDIQQLGLRERGKSVAVFSHELKQLFLWGADVSSFQSVIKFNWIIDRTRSLADLSEEGLWIAFPSRKFLRRELVGVDRPPAFVPINNQRNLAAVVHYAGVFQRAHHAIVHLISVPNKQAV